MASIRMTENAQSREKRLEQEARQWKEASERLDALLESDPVQDSGGRIRLTGVTTDPDKPVRTAEAPVRTAEAPVRTGRYDRMKEAYPERVEFRAEAGTKEALKADAAACGMSVSKYIKEALKYYKEHRNGR